MEPSEFLQPDEEVILQARRHPSSGIMGYVGAGILLVLGLTGLGILTRLGELDIGFAILAPLAVLATIQGLTTFFRVKNSLFVITTERVYSKVGRIFFSLTQSTYDKITDTYVRQGPIGRAKGFGSIVLQTAGRGVSLTGIPDPADAKQRIEATRFQAIDRLVGRGARKPASAKSTQQESEPEAKSTQGPIMVLAEDQPSVPYVVANSVFAGILFVVGLIGVTTLSVFGAFQGIPVFAFMILFGAINLLRSFLRYRYTRYVVTSRGVIVRSGFLNRKEVEASYSKITDVTVNQDLLGRLFGYGDILLNTAGSSQTAVTFIGVTNPAKLRQTIEEARQ